VSYPPGFGRRRVILDPGHGAAGNSGNESCGCEPEQDYTLGLAQELARQLESTGHFEVRLTRAPGQLVAYAPRVAQAESWQAEAFLSLHSDVRGRPEPPGGGAGPACPRANEEPGFAVLWSDEANGTLGAARPRLARALGARLREVGLWPYDGIGYRGLYDGDAAAPGVFVDRHEPGQRIFVLHAPSMASAIIETHNAWNELEARRWHEPATRQALGTAVAAALVDALASSGP
jgi:N-acetylmuramoyl-L-alanine amidase